MSRRARERRSAREAKHYCPFLDPDQDTDQDAVSESPADVPAWLTDSDTRGAADADAQNRSTTA